VEIVTLFPGLRALLLHAKYIEGATSTEDIASLWSRANGLPHDEWRFWQMLAATCLADTISTNIEASTVAQLTSCDAGGLSVLERLLVEYDCS
jgi:aminoglycoside phosphotransferase (APT) family kinase protein